MGDHILSHIDQIRAQVARDRRFSEALPVGPNWVHVGVIRGDGTTEDHGWRPNLRTAAGLEWQIAAYGGGTVVQASPATAVTSTTFTPTGASPWTADELVGKVVVFPVTGITTTPVRGSILSNGTATASVDGWWTPADAIGTTPAGTAAYVILPGMAPARWIGLTAGTATPLTSDTALESELTTNGLGRALATYTAGTVTFIQTATWTATGSATPAKAGLFTGGPGSSLGGILVAETSFSPVALASTDILTVTWTFTMAAAG